MRYVRLIAASDGYDDKPGLIVKGTPQIDGMMADREDGGLIAHDLLEHQNGSRHIGYVWDELEALGGIWHVRGRHGDLMTKHGSMYSVAENVASDLTRMFSDWLSEGAPPFEHRVKATRPHDYDEDFLEIIAISRRDIPREHNDMGSGEPGEPPNGWTSELREHLEAYLTEALHRMRTGYRKAERRFGREHDYFYGHSLYAAVKQAVADAARSIEYEGQEFILGYGERDATCRPVYEDFE
jgi:hypothetical protein